MGSEDGFFSIFGSGSDKEGGLVLRVISFPGEKLATMRPHRPLFLLLLVRIILLFNFDSHTRLRESP